jgi:hypothetical protein
VNAKAEALPPIEPDEKIELKVLKLWRGDTDQTDRPHSVEVEIFCDGNSYKKVILSEENHWTYTWSVQDDNANWTVVERNIPQGYTATVEKRQSTFVLTNTWKNADDPGELPPTGDTTNIMLHILLMLGSGSMLIVMGMIGKKSRL